MQLEYAFLFPSKLGMHEKEKKKTAEFRDQREISRSTTKYKG